MLGYISVSVDGMAWHGAGSFMWVRESKIDEVMMAEKWMEPGLGRRCMIPMT